MPWVFGRREGRSSDSRALWCEGLDHPAWWFDPAWQIHLQFGLFPIPTSVPQAVHQSLLYVLSCLSESAYKRALAIYGDSGFPLKKYVKMTICLTSNSR